MKGMLHLWQQDVAASMVTRRTDPSYRRQENVRNAQAMSTRRTDPSFRRQENDRNAQAMATSCTNPACWGLYSLGNMRY